MGRESERALLSKLLKNAESGQGGLALITGEPGIGKTAFLRQLLQQATKDHIHALVGYCYDLSAPAPYQPWGEAFALVRSDEVTPLGLSLQTNADSSHFSQEPLFREVVDTLSALSDRRPVVIALEDIHWADSASLELLRYVSRWLNDLRVLLLVTYRENDLHQFSPLRRIIASLVREADPPPEYLPLDGLTAAAIDELVERRYGLLHDDQARLVRHLETRAEGNPFFIQEILRSLEEGRIVEPVGNSWRLRTLRHAGVPPLVRQVIEQRLECLDRETHGLLQVAAVIGQNVPIELWQTVSSVSENHLIEIAEQAIAAHVLKETRDSSALQFNHALIRETVYDTLSLPRRRVWHRRVAEAMATAGHAPDDIAFHFERAGDPRATEWYITAGERARRIAWFTAADHFKTAVRLMAQFGYGANERGWLWLRLGLLYRFADPHTSLQQIDRAIDLATDANDAVLSAYATYYRGQERRIIGDVRGGIAEEEAGVTALDALSPSVSQYAGDFVGTGFQIDGLNPHANLVGIQANQGNFDSARRLANRIVADSAACHNTTLHDISSIVAIGPHLYYGVGAVLAGTGYPHGAHIAFTQSRTGFRALYDPVLAGSVAFWELLWVSLPYHADSPELRSKLAIAAEEDWSRAAGAQGGWDPQMAWLPILMLEGRWDTARELAEASNRKPKAAPRYEFAQSVLVRLAREEGTPDAAWNLICHTLPDGPTTEPGGMYYLPTVELLRLAVNLALDAMDMQSVRSWLHAYDRWLEWSGAHLGRAESDLFWAMHEYATGDAERAFARVGHALSAASEPRQPLALIAIHRFLGTLLTGTGAWVDAEQHLSQAQQLAAVCQSPLDVAETKLTLAELRLVQQRPTDAAELLDGAREICLALGAVRVLEIADALAGRLGSTKKVGAYSAGLSAREHEVLTLVVAGLTNAKIADRLFLSHRTVEQHLRSAYKKLGVTSRVAATRYAIEHGLI